MPLIIGVNKGDTFSLNTDVLKVLDTSKDNSHIYIDLSGTSFLLNTSEFVEIAPTVFACVGTSKHRQTSQGERTLPRLAIDAPRSIAIKRLKTAAPHDRHIQNTTNP
jgi:hypothetical protein